MIIGVDIRTFVASQITGVGIYTWEILNQLFSRDNKNSYKLFFNQARGNILPKIRNLKNFSNVTIVERHFPSKLFNLSLNYFRRPALDKLVGGADVFWFPNLNFWQVGRQVKTVVTIHDLSFLKLPWAFSPKMRLWHKVIKPREKLEQAHKIIAVSQNTKRDLMELYSLPAEKIAVVYSGTIVEQSFLKVEQVKKKYNLPDNFILFLGTLEPRKNVEGVIAAFNLINRPDLNLIIVGGRGWLYKRIYQLAKNSPLSKQIRFTDYILPSDRFAFYQSAKMFIWPTFYEGFGFPPLEAMKFGCPVITSNNSSLPEVMGEAALLINPYNTKEIAWAINQLLTNEVLRQDLISRGYRQVKKFSWQKTAAQMLEVFQSL